MFAKILIANRGEIALRVMRTAQALGIRCVAVYSDADQDSLHVRQADEAVRLGPAPSRESYLRADRLIEIAQATGAEAIHPGYGFLAENAEFAAACEAAGIVFIGPKPSSIAAMGSKAEAKRLMETAGVPLVPGYHGADQGADLLAAEAERIGYPVLLKATAGGGGKGMRVVNAANEFAEALAGAKREALNGFGDDRMLIEKYLARPRHVEVQVLADSLGHAVYLFDRDCSVQRRHQKVVEEAPAPGLSETMRAAMGEAAVRAAQAIDYRGAGTIEFLVEGDAFYFMEMNTRLQVEHPVTERITGLDLVEWQLRVAAGEPLAFAQCDLRVQGHAVEVRLYAEDCRNDFLPAPGALLHFATPALQAGQRVDAGYRSGDTVTPYYDPMMAKLIAWGETRTQAIQRLDHLLAGTEVAGVHHNLAFLRRVIRHPDFIAGELSTRFIEQHPALLNETPLSDALIAVGAILLLEADKQQRSVETGHRDANSPWHQTTNWRPVGRGSDLVRFTLQQQPHERLLTELERSAHGVRYQVRAANGASAQDYACDRDECGRLQVRTAEGRFSLGYRQIGSRHFLFDGGQTLELVPVSGLPNAADAEAGDAHYRAPMNGRVAAVVVVPGQQVQAGETLLILEAMKMEHRIKAHQAGEVIALHVANGELVSEGQNLVDLQAEDER